MTTMELKKYILEHDLVPKILEALGCKDIRKQLKGVSASNPDGDNKTAIFVYTNSNFINVKNYTRDIKEHADIIDLVQFFKKCNFNDACKWLHKQAGLKWSYYQKEPVLIKENPFTRLLRLKSTKYELIPPRPIDESVLGEFTSIEWEGLYREGVMPVTCKRFGVMYSYKWRRIIYPHRYALDGSLLAYNARTTVENWEEFGIPKFYITPGYKKTDNVYGLWENRESIEEEGLCVVVESEKSVLKRHSMFDERFVAVSGHTISSEQRRILAGINVPEIVISFDNDVSEMQIWAACEKIYPFKIVSYTKDTDDLLGPKDSIVDIPDILCRRLINERVRYDHEKHEQYKKEVAKGKTQYAINR